MTSDDLMSAREIAEVFGVSIHTVRDWIYKRRLLPPAPEWRPGPTGAVACWPRALVEEWGRETGRLK